jgi:hypothetical protein
VLNLDAHSRIEIGLMQRAAFKCSCMTKTEIVDAGRVKLSTSVCADSVWELQSIYAIIGAELAQKAHQLLLQISAEAYRSFVLASIVIVHDKQINQIVKGSNQWCH